MKFGKVKKQHGRVPGLDELLARIVKHCEHVSRIVPGRITTRRGVGNPQLKIQYPTTAGLKCLYVSTGTVQEVFLVCSDEAAASAWLIQQGLVSA